VTADCDRLWEVDAYRSGQLGPRDAESFVRHARACATCRARLEGDERLRDLVAATLSAEPSELGLRRLRARVLRDAARGEASRSATPLRWRPLAAGALLVALGVVTWSLCAHPGAARAPALSASARTAAPLSAEEAFAGAVAAAPGARWSQVRRARVERVELTDGTIRVKVRPQSQGERFLIALPDGEIEVRGTEFDVEVERGATQLVRVVEGVVDLRLDGREFVRLVASESWRRERPEGSALEAPPPRSVPNPPEAVRTAASVHSGKAAGAADDSVAMYADAVRCLRDGMYDEAASRFHGLFLADPSSSQAEDASFLEAVALARAGRADAAALAGEHHLASFPRSFHAREAAILVARAASQRHDCEKARRVVAPWATGALVPPDVQSALAPCAADPTTRDTPATSGASVAREPGR